MGILPLYLTVLANWAKEQIEEMVKKIVYREGILQMYDNVLVWALPLPTVRIFSNPAKDWGRWPLQNRSFSNRKYKLPIHLKDKKHLQAQVNEKYSSNA